MEAEIKSVADELGKHSRLFALTAEEDGQVEFSELRSGEPVCITRIRVDFSATQTRPISPFVPSDDMWRGDVEPIPFPFPFGLTSDKLAGIAFDAEATRLLVATRQPMLHVWTIADGKVEVLPRPLIAGRLATGTHFLGVRDGFIVAGTMDANLFAVHYDFRTRIVKAHRLGKSDGKGAPLVQLSRLARGCTSTGLCVSGLGSRIGGAIPGTQNTRSFQCLHHQAYVRALDRPVPEPWVEVIRADFSATPVPQHFAIYYNPNRGWLFAGNHFERKSWCPEIEVPVSWKEFGLTRPSSPAACWPCGTFPRVFLSIIGASFISTRNLGHFAILTFEPIVFFCSRQRQVLRRSGQKSSSKDRRFAG